MKSEIFVVLGVYLYSVFAGILIGMKLAGVVNITWLTALIPFLLPFFVVAIWVGFLIWWLYETNKDYESD